MPKYGMISSAIIPVSEEIRHAANAGFDYMELGMEEPLGTPRMLLRQKDSILKDLKKYNLSIIGHTAYWVEFGTSHPDVRKGWINEGKRMIDAAHALKIKRLNFHFNGGHGQTMQKEFGRKIFIRNFIKSMTELNRYARDRGITLMLENSEGKNRGIKGYSSVINGVPGLMVHLDIAHAFIEGGMNGIHSYITKFSGKLVHVHIHDNHGKTDEHLPLGKGSIDFKKVVTWLKEVDYDGTITFEVFHPPDIAQLIKSRKFLDSLWNSQ